MNPLDIICKYCTNEKQLHILLVHSRAVADKALRIARRHPEWFVDELFIEEAEKRYQEKYGKSPKVYDVVIGDGSRKLD